MVGCTQPNVTQVFQKVMVNGDETHDVFKFCRSATLPSPAKGQPGAAQKKGEAIGWNFGKYVIDGDGQVILRLGPKETVKVLDTPEHLGRWAATATMGAAGPDPAIAAASAAIDEALKAAPLVIFSKTTCGYSKKAKDLVAGMDLPVPAHIVEIDERDDSDAMQDRLEELTGSRTVPRVFADGKFIGGCDEIVAAHESGALEKTLREAGAYGTEPEPE